MAYGRQRAPSRTTTKSTPKRPEHAALAEHLGHALAGVLQLGAVAVVRRELAPDEHLAGPPAEHLLVGRDDLDHAPRVDPALHRRRAHLVAGDERLGDAAHLRELVRVALPGQVRRLEQQAARQPAGDARLRAGAGVAREKAEARVPLAREPVVQLDDGRLEGRLAPLQRGQRRGDVLPVPERLEPVRRRHPRRLEDLPRQALGAEVGKLRIAAVDGDAESSPRAFAPAARR